MKHIKIVCVVVTLVFCQLLLIACSSSENRAAPATSQQTVSEQSKQTTEVELQQEGPWQITFLGSQAFDALNATQNSLQYSGENVSTQIQDTPDEGKVFFLVELKIDKLQVGASAFKWDQLFLEDYTGERYQRHSNDSFLENYGYKRIKSTDLTLGSNEGYICFEISAQAAQATLSLGYEADDESVHMTLN